MQSALGAGGGCTEEVGFKLEKDREAGSPGRWTSARQFRAVGACMACLGRLHGARCHGAVSSPGRRALNVRLRAFLWEAVGSHQRFINTGVTGADLEAHSGGHE